MVVSYFLSSRIISSFTIVQTILLSEQYNLSFLKVNLQPHFTIFSPSCFFHVNSSSAFFLELKIWAVVSSFRKLSRHSTARDSVQNEHGRQRLIFSARVLSNSPILSQPYINDWVYLNIAACREYIFSRINSCWETTRMKITRRSSMRLNWINSRLKLFLFCTRKPANGCREFFVFPVVLWSAAFLNHSAILYIHFLIFLFLLH